MDYWLQLWKFLLDTTSIVLLSCLLFVLSCDLSGLFKWSQFRGWLCHRLTNLIEFTIHIFFWSWQRTIIVNWLFKSIRKLNNVLRIFLILFPFFHFFYFWQICLALFVGRLINCWIKFWSLHAWYIVISLPLWTLLSRTLARYSRKPTFLKAFPTVPQFYNTFFLPADSSSIFTTIIIWRLVKTREPTWIFRYWLDCLRITSDIRSILLKSRISRNFLPSLDLNALYSWRSMNWIWWHHISLVVITWEIRMAASWSHYKEIHIIFSLIFCWFLLTSYSL